MARSRTNIERIRSYLVILTAYFSFAACPLSYPASSSRIVESALGAELSQSTILSIIESSDGILWIATLDGISRYDGYRVERFRQSSMNDEREIPSANIGQLFEGEDNNIYATTYGAGLIKFDESSNEFKGVRFLIESEPQSLNVSEGMYDQAGHIWLGLQNGALMIVNEKLGSTRIFQLDSKSRISDIYRTSGGNFYVGTQSGRIFSIQPSIDRINELKLSKECQQLVSSAEEILTIDDETFWIGTQGNGLILLEGRGRHCSRVELTQTENRSHQQSTIHKLEYDEVMSELWVASDQGLYLIDSSNSQQHFHSHNSKLANDEVTALFWSRSSNHWIGTYSGLNMMSKSSFSLHNNSEHPLLHSIVAIGSSENLGTWIASYDGLLFYDAIRQTHLQIKSVFPQSALFNQRIMSLLVEDERIWLGYRSSGLQYFDATTGETISYSTQSSPGLSSDSIATLLRSQDGNLYVGTYGGGLNIIHPSGQIYQYTPGQNKGSLSSKKVILLYQTSDNRIWVGTEGGLYIFDTENLAFEEVKIEFGEPNVTIAPTIWCMDEAPDGGMWFCSRYRGLFYTRKSPDNSAPTLKTHPSPKYIQDTTIYALKVDHLGALWLSTNNGIARIAPDGKTQFFRKAHGLQEMEFEFGASHIDSEGRIYFGGSQGYNSFQPQNVSIASPPPPVILTNLIIGGGTALGFQKARDLQKIDLSYTDYLVTLSFSALDFLDPSSNQYRYKLEEFDPDWIEIGNRNSATYTNLPAGEYSFRVQAANSAGVWNLEGVRLGVTVHPAPWYTWWAFTGYALLVLCAFLVAKRIYDDHKYKEQSKKFTEQMQTSADLAWDDVQDQIEHQGALVRSFHRFNTSTLELVGECFRRGVEFQSGDCVEEEQLSQLGRLTALQCLEDALLHQGEYLLADLHKYVNLLAQRLIEDYTYITIINEVTRDPVPAELASPVALVLYELMANSVTHAFEDRAAGNYLRIHFRRLEPPVAAGVNLILEVQDNGIGLPDSISLHSPESTGLSIVADLATRLGGELSVVVDNGTTVQLCFCSEDF